MLYPHPAVAAVGSRFSSVPPRIVAVAIVWMRRPAFQGGSTAVTLWQRRCLGGPEAVRDAEQSSAERGDSTSNESDRLRGRIRYGAGVRRPRPHRVRSPLGIQVWSASLPSRLARPILEVPPGHLAAQRCARLDRDAVDHPGIGDKGVVRFATFEVGPRDRFALPPVEIPPARSEAAAQVSAGKRDEGALRRGSIKARSADPTAFLVEASFDPEDMTAPDDVAGRSMPVTKALISSEPLRLARPREPARGPGGGCPGFPQ